MDCIAVVTTVGNREEAQMIARTLVKAKIVACAQISEIESFYHWQGSLEHDKEFRILCKTTSLRYPEVEATILKLHSYELPAIYAYPLSHIYTPYGEWIENNSSHL
ncbi:divalent-cation tolerance protein CutA [Calothrix sp. 336/3]|uniref:divalent-cation tolerance protein CutA n=1 Tax=Calothrix sp. 336/3 TaxID=1337936 RepID=UPI0004E3E299|nr:divalent-cation tolerance protein CutA [Calothrix sp. 336/3]AKG23681.1 cytochrome C biogenesis protein [Calothrix sp. 336/3]